MKVHPRLPFVPEPFWRLKQRYNSALMQVFDCRYGIPRPVPSGLRGHIFDCEDGLRLIVSKDRIEEGIFLHVSASIEPNTKLWMESLDMTSRGQTYEELQAWWAAQAMIRYRMLSSDDKDFDMLKWTEEKGIPHWWRKVA